MRPREFDHIAESAFGIDGFRQNYIRPENRVHHAERIENVGQSGGQKNASDDLKFTRAKRQSRLHEFFGNGANRKHDDRQKIYKNAEKQKRDLLRFVDAEIPDQTAE